MNTKRLMLACVAVLLFNFLFDWVLHGPVLRTAYMDTAQLWRTEADMRSHFGWLVFGQIFMAVMFCLIYALRRAPESGAAQGAGYGFLAALLLSSGYLIAFATEPIPANIIGTWLAGEVIKLAIAGAILGAIYRPPSARSVGSAQPAPA